MRYLFLVFFGFCFGSCHQHPKDYEAILAFDSVEPTTANGTSGFENTPLQAGDSILVFRGNQGFLKAHFGCDTCHAKVKQVFFSKPTGQIAFVQFEENPSSVVTYSLSLYYWGNKRGYNVSTLMAWERALTAEEQDLLSSDFITYVAYRPIENNLYFKQKR